MRHVALLLVLAGCAAPSPLPCPTVLSFPSELPPDAALGLARNVLRRSGWPIVEATVESATAARRGAFATEWRDAAGGPVRLLVDTAEADGGASTTVRVRGETRVGGRAVPVVQPAPGRPSAAWAVVTAAARRVGAEVRYARP